MGYLICKKCNGYYKLQEGESPEDFRECQCGGKLNYVESMKRSENLKNKFKLSSKITLRIVGVTFGALIMLVPCYLFSPIPATSSFVFDSTNSFILWGAGGFLAAVIAGGKIINGPSNGFYAAIISGFVVIILFYMMSANYFNSPSSADNIAFFAALAVVYMLIPAIFSMLGGLVGILIRNSVVRDGRLIRIW